MDYTVTFLPTTVLLVVTVLANHGIVSNLLFHFNFMYQLLKSSYVKIRDHSHLAGNYA